MHKKISVCMHIHVFTFDQSNKSKHMKTRKKDLPLPPAAFLENPFWSFLHTSTGSGLSNAPGENPLHVHVPVGHVPVCEATPSWKVQRAKESWRGRVPMGGHVDCMWRNAPGEQQLVVKFCVNGVWVLSFFPC